MVKRVVGIWSARGVMRVCLWLRLMILGRGWCRCLGKGERGKGCLLKQRGGCGGVVEVTKDIFELQVMK